MSNLWNIRELELESTAPLQVNKIQLDKQLMFTPELKSVAVYFKRHRAILLTTETK